MYCHEVRLIEFMFERIQGISVRIRSRVMSRIQLIARGAVVELVGRV
jgi:hypothetical protein